jgi:hypothetical protein
LTTEGWVLGFAFATAWIFSASHLNRRHLLPAPDGTILGAKTLTLSDDGVRHASAHHESVYRWTAVCSVGETPQHIFICVDTISGIMVPKRSFSSPEAAKQWLDEVRRRSGK